MTTTATASAAALEIRAVTKCYGALKAVQNVSFTVENGIFGLLGANGAGKSTLLKSILGVIPIDSGEVLVCGRKNTIFRQSYEAKRLIGYLPEELRLYERLTGREFLEFVAGLKDKATEAEIDEGLDYFGMTPKQHVLIEEYSHGMRKKIGIIAALLGKPPLILLDEPLNGLDAESMRRLRLKIEALTQEGVTVVLSSHIMGFVERVCQRIAIVKKGELVQLGTPAEVRAASGLHNEPFDDVFLHFAL